MADTSTRRRVKLYMLNDDRLWDDRGTGHVSSVYVERLKGMSLLVRSESDGSLLLESKIQPDTAYQKQQETLIVWSEADNYDLALSFQEKAGCDEIWEKICSVQGKDPSVDITQDVVEESEDERFEEIPDAAPPIELPPCELSKLDEISELCNSVLPSPIRREKLAVAIESEGYIKKLVDLFNMCEDLENVEGLHHLYDIFKSIFLLNKNALFEIMFGEDMIHDIVGVLEYDPSLPHPAKHRDYLRSKATFREVIPLNNPELVQKIHQTYRVQYIQDVILPTPSVFEENMLSTLNSFIFFNKVEIVSMVQEDERFLRSLFDQLVDDETDDGKRKDLVLFLKEFCTFSQILQPASRDTFFKTLSDMGILKALETILGLDDEQMKAAAIDIFSYVVEFSPPMVREFIVEEGQKQDDDDLLINLVIEQLISDTDPELGGAVQLMGIIRLLIDPENMLATASKTEKTEFLGFFYKHSMHVLTAPLFAHTVDASPSKDDYQTAQLLSVILELLTFCIEHHTYHIKNYVLTKDLLRRVLVLLKSKHAFLALGALRLMRRVVGLKDEFYNRYLVRGDLFKPVVEAFKANGTKYNLLNSAMIEMFEFIRIEDIKSLISHIVENHYRHFENVDYVQTFKNLQQRYEQLQDRLRDRTSIDSFSPTVPSILRNNRYRRDARALDEEEEMYFDNEEEMEDSDAIVSMNDMIKSPINEMIKAKYDSSDFEQINKILEKRGSKENELKETAPKINNRTAMTISFNINSNKSPPASNPVTPACSPVSSPVSSSPQINVDSVSPAPDTKSLSSSSPALAPSAAAASAMVENSSDNPSPPIKKLFGLVDYDADSDDEEEESTTENDGVSVSKRARLST